MENSYTKWKELQEEKQERDITSVSKAIVQEVLNSEDDYEAQYIVEEKINELIESEKIHDHIRTSSQHVG